MNVRWGVLAATVLFTVTLGIAFGPAWACIPAGLCYLGTVRGK